MSDITGMQPAGKVLPIWRGDYNNATYYEQTDIVLYNNSSYIAKQDTIGNPPPEPADNANEYWQLVAKGIVDADISDATVEFAQADKRENIESSESMKTLFGKIKKWFADDKVTNDKNGHDITKTYAEKSLVGAERAIDGTSNIEYTYPNIAIGQGIVSSSINTLNTAVKESTQKITDSVLGLNLAVLSRNNHIDVLTTINQITNIGFWKINSIDANYAQSMGIRPADNVGDFYAIVSNYNGDGVNHFVYGNLQLFSPRLGVNYFTIQVWDENATAKCMITHDNLLNTTEQISANTESLFATGALAAKAMMADYNNKINQINSNMGVWIDVLSTANVYIPISTGKYCSYLRYNTYTKQIVGVLCTTSDANVPNQSKILTFAQYLDEIKSLTGLCGSCNYASDGMLVTPRIENGSIISSHSKRLNATGEFVYLIDFVIV